MEIDGRSAAKGEVIVDFGMKEVADFLHQPTTLRKLNPQLES